MRLLFLEDTLGMVCGNPDCNCGSELYMHGRCHMRDMTHAEVHNDHLVIDCGVCERHIGAFAIQPTEENSAWDNVWVRLAHGKLTIIDEDKEELQSFKLRSNPNGGVPS